MMMNFQNLSSLKIKNISNIENIVRLNKNRRQTVGLNIRKISDAFDLQDKSRLDSSYIKINKIRSPKLSKNNIISIRLKSILNARDKKYTFTKNNNNIHSLNNQANERRVSSNINNKKNSQTGKTCFICKEYNDTQDQVVQPCPCNIIYHQNCLLDKIKPNSKPSCEYCKNFLFFKQIVKRKFNPSKCLKFIKNYLCKFLITALIILIISAAIFFLIIELLSIKNCVVLILIELGIFIILMMVIMGVTVCKNKKMLFDEIEIGKLVCDINEGK